MLHNWSKNLTGRPIVKSEIRSDRKNSKKKIYYDSKL